MPRTRVRTTLELWIKGGKGTTQLGFFDRYWDDVTGCCENIEYR
jgi:hypothetical protein